MPPFAPTLPAVRPDVDLIGVLYHAAAFPEGWLLGNPLPEPITRCGWHANVTAAHAQAHPGLAPFIVTPSMLRRVWAGDDPAAPALTVALRFADQAEAEAALAEG